MSLGTCVESFVHQQNNYLDPQRGFLVSECAKCKPRVEVPLLPVREVEAVTLEPSLNGVLKAPQFSANSSPGSVLRQVAIGL